MRWRSFVAVGDSFTEGLDDPHPSAGGYRGWADLVAWRLSAITPPGFAYANLAVRGRLFDAIIDEQVPAAIAMKPDLISFAGGGNDVLRPSVELEPMLARFDDTIGSMRAAGADVVVFRFADVTQRLPGKKLIVPRVLRLNEAVGEVADRHGATLVDLWSDDEFYNPRLWSVDRLHLSAAGHRRVAGHVLQALGVEPDPQWMAVPAPEPAPTWARRRAHDLVWIGRYLLPWVKRRLLGRSSGDLVNPKRPTLSPISE